MNLNKQITTVGEIKQIVESLQKCYGTSSMALHTLTSLRVKLQVDFSPGCTECGQYAGFIKDCRDTLIVTQIKSMVVFMASVGNLISAIDLDGNTLNRDAAKDEAGAAEPQDQQ